MQVRMDFTRAGDFFAAPFPSDDLVDDAGHVKIAEFPNDKNVLLVRQSKELLARDARGFSLAGGVFFALSGAVAQANLPSLTQSIGAESKVFLVEVSSSGLRRIPVDVAFQEDGGPFGAPNLLSLVPLQGMVLKPATLHAAVVLRSLGDADGKPLGVSLPMAELAAGRATDHLTGPAAASYASAVQALVKGGVEASSIAGLAVFRTDDPTAAMRPFVDVAKRVNLVPSAFEKVDDFPAFCVFRATVSVPVFQSGDAPYSSVGGDWLTDEQGPIRQADQTARLFVTVPRRAMPVGGYPTAVFVRTGGGGDRPLVDRGVRTVAGKDPPTNGTGPARELAAIGFAGVSLDGPHGGPRNVTGGDEQFLMFNFLNGAALRDNVRQSALEIALIPALLPKLVVDASSCDGPAAVRFDADHLALMGHSMGATIAPIAAAFAPAYRALVVSGAGASWIENVLHKRHPLEVKPFAEVLLGYAGTDRSLSRHDPVLTLVQWSVEPADTQVYAEPLLAHRPHTLMFQGIVDGYILPNIANTLSLSLGLDAAGTLLDDDPRLAGQHRLAEMLPFTGRSTLPFPVLGNIGGVTGVVTQHLQDALEDGHEVMFQRDEPKHQYRCFLDGFARGTPVVVAPDAADAPCPVGP